MAPPTERERLATLEADLRNLQRRVDGHHGTLYGTQGGGGLNSDFRTLDLEFRHHVQEEAELHDNTAKVLVGNDGDGGVVADVGALMEDRARARWILRVVGSLAALVVADLMLRIVQWLAE